MCLCVRVFVMSGHGYLDWPRIGVRGDDIEFFRGRVVARHDTIAYSLLTTHYIIITAMTKSERLTEQLENVLPQTQCRDCLFDGCKPYAEAMANGEAQIDRCLPGGVETLKDLGHIMGVDPEPFEQDMLAKQKPAQVAVIREEECIGCTKCIQACPIDAIIGGPKVMTTILATDCSGCELCISPCPVDCIDLVPLPEPSSETKKANAIKYKHLYENRNKRLARWKLEDREKYLAQKNQEQSRQETVDARKKFIAEAMKRTKEKTSDVRRPAPDK